MKNGYRIDPFSPVRTEDGLISDHPSKTEKEEVKEEEIEEELQEELQEVQEEALIEADYYILSLTIVTP